MCVCGEGGGGGGGGGEGMSEGNVVSGPCEKSKRV